VPAPPFRRLAHALTLLHVANTSTVDPLNHDQIMYCLEMCVTLTANEKLQVPIPKPQAFLSQTKSSFAQDTADHPPTLKRF